MALKQIREIPHTLPIAHLYLDDVADITEILLQARRETLERQDAYYFPDSSEEDRTERLRKREPKVKYIFGSKKQMSADSIDDLKFVGGSRTSFEIEVDSSGVEMSWFAEPRISLAGLDFIENRRAVYQQIQSIFANRGLGLTNALRTIPEWLRVFFSTPLWALLILAFVDYAHVSRNSAIALIGFTFGLWALLLWIYVRPSRVFFAEFHEKSKLSSASRRQHFRDFVFALLGGAITFVVEILVKKITH